MSKKVCYPIVRVNRVGGSHESTFLLTSTLPDRYEPLIAFFKQGSVIERAEEYGLTWTTINSKSDSVDKYIRSDNLIIKTIYLIILLTFLPQMMRIIENKNIDIIHTNSVLATVLWGPVAMIKNRSLIVHIRDERPSTFNPLILFFADHLIFVAESNKHKFDSERLEKTNHSVIHNGVDTGEFVPRSDNSIRSSLDIPCDAPLVGFVGNLVKRKRPELFVEAAMNALDERNDIHFLVVGKDTNATGQALQNSVKERGYGKNFHFLGYRSDMPHIMASLDLLVLTSTRHGEAFPRVPLEAMACKTPVITTDTAGVSEVVVDGKNGILLDTDPTADVISDSMLELISNDELRSDMAEQGRATIQQDFSVGTVTASIVNIYDRYC